MIKFVPVEDTLNLRNQVLREGKLSLEECRFDGDELDESFHLAYVFNEEVISVATFHPKGLENYTGVGFQLRGMATLPQFRGKALGNQLLNFAITYLRSKKVNYLWCNARKNALVFYQNIGFEVVSKEFEITGVGLHNILYLKIQN